MEKTRRNFLRESLLGVGALLVAPPMIANVLNVNERNIDKYKAKKACRKPFFFIQYSDPQFGFTNGEKYDTKPEEELMEKSVEIINRLSPPFVIGTGDFWHHKRYDPEMLLYKKYMSKIDPKTKIFNVPGNHDFPSLEDEDQNYYHTNFGPSRFSFRHERCAFIGINSQYYWPEREENEYEKEQYEWLIHELESAKKCRFIFVFAHIPFFLEKDDEPEDYFCVKQPLRNKYIETFKRYGVNAIFCGHKHKNFVGKSGNLDMVTCGAIGLPLGGFHGMNLIRVFPDQYDFNYISLDDFPKAIEKNTLNLL